MNCLECDVPMKEIQLSGVSVDVCGDCGGIWFDSGEVEEMFRNRFQGRLLEIPKDVHFKSFGPTLDDLCPSCSRPDLCAGALKTVPFWTCGACGGVFIKAQDVERLVGTPGPKALTFDVFRVDPVDTVLDTLFFGPEIALLLHVRRRIAETVGEESR